MLSSEVVNKVCGYIFSLLNFNLILDPNPSSSTDDQKSEEKKWRRIIGVEKKNLRLWKLEIFSCLFLLLFWLILKSKHV